MTTTNTKLYEVFIRSHSTTSHQHVGSLRATSSEDALLAARDLYARRNEGCSLWVVDATQIQVSEPDQSALLFEPAKDKPYRHPTFYPVPDGVENL